MRQKHLRFGTGFRVLFGNKRSQAAQMTLGPGETEGGADNRHRGADQWLFVVSGIGEAVINSKKHSLKAGSLVLIEHGDEHAIKNTGRKPLQTLNIYVPPAYSPEGKELSAGKS